jgi:hypothetical protein
MAKVLDSATAARIRADLAAAQAPGPETTFIDRIAALERAFTDLLNAIEAAR